MKLRLRQNSLRLRVNRREVAQLASGAILREEVHFPGSRLAYELASEAGGKPDASYSYGLLRISFPQAEFAAWANRESVGIYFELQANLNSLRVAIEKDLECVDGPEEERDPQAFPRKQSIGC